MKEIKKKFQIKGNEVIFNGIFPIKASIRTEIIAGLILAAIGIPEVMGYAKIVGMPIITGLYTILIPLAIFAIFCSSRHLIIGADSATAAILISTLATVAAIGSPQYIGLVSLAAILCAILLLIARVFKLGFIADFMSRTVLVGFLTGVGIQIAISQLSTMFGLMEGRGGESTITKLAHFSMHLSEIHLITLLIAIFIIITVLGFRRVSPKFPGELIAVIGTITFSYFFDLSKWGVQLVGNVPGGFPSLVLPSLQLSLNDFPTLLTAAGACFVVIIAQSAATSRAYSFRYSEEVDENKDILGLALANGAAGLTGTFVVNGSPTKTEIVSNAGSRSQLSSIITVLIVVLVLLFFTGPISILPNVTLASIVFLIGIGMVDIKGLKDIRHKMKSEYYLAIVTALTVVLFSVLWGILLSILFSMLLHLSHSYMAVNSILIKNDKGKWIFAPIDCGRSTKKGLIIYRFNRDLYYANSDLLRKQVIKLVKNADNPLKWFVLDAGGFEAIDYTSAEMLKELKGELKKRNIKFVIATTIPLLRDQMESLGLTGVIGEENIYVSAREALEAFESENN
ncbi:MAG: SulP family inorganic anion transporter [Methanobacterium sp.]